MKGFCLINIYLSLCSIGSFNSVYALHTSFFIMNNSNRSVNPGAERCHFANGDIICG